MNALQAKGQSQGGPQRPLERGSWEGRERREQPYPTRIVGGRWWGGGEEAGKGLANTRCNPSVTEEETETQAGEGARAATTMLQQSPARSPCWDVICAPGCEYGCARGCQAVCMSNEGSLRVFSTILVTPSLLDAPSFLDLPASPRS